MPVLGFTTEKVINVDDEKKIAVVPGSAFMVSEDDVTYSFRKNYSTPTDEAIDRGVEILGGLTREMFG